MFNRIRPMLVNSLLLVGLIGLLTVYLAVVSDLPSRIYTIAQQEYLSYNYERSISQVAPTWNLVQSGGQAIPTILPGQESHIRATLTAHYEEQEGVSVPVYDLEFRGAYRLAHFDPAAATVELFFPFPGNLETLHEVRFLVDGEEPAEVQYTTRGISWQTMLLPGEEHQIVVSYQADGAHSFTYGLHHGQRSDVDIAVTVDGLTGSEVPKNFLPPTARKASDDGEIFAWDYTGLIADRDIQLTLPNRLSFAQRVAQLQDDFRTLATRAPFLVGLFLASLAGAFHLGQVRLQLESYLLVGCGLAFFYPTLTFLSGMINVIWAAVLALLLVSGLLLVFVGLTAGWRQTWWQTGLLLVIFLGVFSLGMLTPWRGLLLTGGGLLLVGTFMLLYARRPAAPESETVSPPAQVAPMPDETIPGPPNLHCPYCARELADDYSFCPGCGHDTDCFHRCGDCGHRQFVPAERKAVYCTRCGQSLT